MAFSSGLAGWGLLTSRALGFCWASSPTWSPCTRWLKASHRSAFSPACCCAVRAAARESRSASVRCSRSHSFLLFQASALAASFAVVASAWACQQRIVCLSAAAFGSIMILDMNVCAMVPVHLRHHYLYPANREGLCASSASG